MSDTNLGQVHQTQSLPHLPIDLLRQATERFPKSAFAQEELGKALLASGEPEEACRAFERAAEMGGDQASLFKTHATAVEQDAGLAAAAPLYRVAIAKDRRLFPIDPPCPPLTDWTADEARRILERCDRLLEAGIVSSQILGHQAVALHLLGENGRLKELLGLDRFLHKGTLPTPPGYPSLDAFNQALVEEIGGDPGLRFYEHPQDRAIHGAWRKDDMASAKEPACRALYQAIGEAVERYIAALPDGDHVLLASRPSRYRIGSWAVVSTLDGHHRPHIHPNGWINCVYYVERPPTTRLPGNSLGRFHAGPPVPTLDGAPTAWRTAQFEPEPGTLLIMPAYHYHWTLPTGLTERRICVAFDVEPLD